MDTITIIARTELSILAIKYIHHKEAQLYFMHANVMINYVKDDQG